jgi:hypothetical protein
MTTEPDGLRVLGLLDRLYSRYGPQVFGQVMQRLLAAAFALSGREVVPNAVGVPDFTATNPGIPHGFGVEVKTTADGAVVLSERELMGVMNSGHTPVVAFLDYPSEDPKWHLLDAASLKAGTYEALRLVRTPKAIIDLDANALFRELLVEYHSAAMISTAALEHALTAARRGAG